MSEYQFYEFQAIDRPLDGEAQAEISKLSSRVQMTSHSACFVYHFGNFRGNPYGLMTQYFDAMLYITNWGTRQVMFRFPANALPADVQKAYQSPVEDYGSGIEWSQEGEHVILNIEYNDEDGGDGEWIEGEGLLRGLVQVREDILRGDYRALYLVWLKLAYKEYDLIRQEYDGEEIDADDEIFEPEVPPDLGRQTPALRNWVEFFGVDADLIAAGAQASPSASASSELSPYLEQLSADEMRAFLQRLLQGEARLDLALRQRLREFVPAQLTTPVARRRTMRELAAAADVIEKERKAASKRKAQATHEAKMKTLEPQADKLWKQVDGLIAMKTTTAYDEAVTLLKDLRDLAAYQRRTPEFKQRIAAIQERYPTLSGLKRRMEQAKLL
jgi:hypothetical protein